MNQYNNELYHYGVKGMKWGVRRSKGSKSSNGQKLSKRMANSKIGKAYKRSMKRKNKIDSVYQDINRSTSMKSKLLYNPATRKAAAKYVVDKNMKVPDAVSKAQRLAWINSGAALVAIAGSIAIEKSSLGK